MTTIWNYTTLKRVPNISAVIEWFDYHMELHYSQTVVTLLFFHHAFDYHMELHYSQTPFTRV